MQHLQPQVFVYNQDAKAGHSGLALNIADDAAKSVQ
jgi:hypothetical protein